MTDVRAAGGIVWRTGAGGSPEVAVVHRPRYDDWSFPKGKVQVGETDEKTALREVEEELGMRCWIERDLGTIEYADHEGRHKVVRYWTMSALAGSFSVGDEVDEARWLPPSEAMGILSYEHDRVLLRSSIAPGEAPAYLVRHAKAGDRERWKERDELRPLTKKGRWQAEALLKMFRGLDVARVISSPYVRCVQTVRPLALDRGLPIDTSEVLAEGAATTDVLALLDQLAFAPTVLCSHGDVIPSLVLHLVDRGATIVGERDWKKGSTWMLEREDGRVVRASYLPPPDVD
jgi:8-oxo-(d)GTP phosphatase